MRVGQATIESSCPMEPAGESARCQALFQPLQRRALLRPKNTLRAIIGQRVIEISAVEPELPRLLYLACPSAMPIPDRLHLLTAVVLLLTAAFVASVWIKPPFGIWWRRAVIVGYLLAVGLVLVRVTKWLMGF